MLTYEIPSERIKAEEFIELVRMLQIDDPYTVGRKEASTVTAVADDGVLSFLITNLAQETREDTQIRLGLFVRVLGGQVYEGVYDETTGEMIGRRLILGDASA